MNKLVLKGRKNLIKILNPLPNNCIKLWIRTKVIIKNVKSTRKKNFIF